MKRYIIDGYNALFLLHKGIPSPSLYTARKKLIDVVVAAAQSFHSAQLILIFDAHERHKNIYSTDRHMDLSFDTLFSRSHKGLLEIIFTGRDETADAFIQNYFMNLAKKSRDILVSSDKKLAKSIAVMGFSTISVVDFLKLLTQQTKKQLKNQQRDHKLASTSSATGDTSYHSPTKKANKPSVCFDVQKKPHALFPCKVPLHNKSATVPSTSIQTKITPEQEREYLFQNKSVSTSFPTLTDNQGWQNLFEEKLSLYEEKKANIKKVKKKKR